MTKINTENKITGIGIIAKLEDGSHYQVLVEDSDCDKILDYIASLNPHNKVKLLQPEINSIKIT